MSLHVIVYDSTQTWLTASWWVGAAFRSLRKGRDEILPVSSWEEMQLELLQFHGVEQVDYWGHGASGEVYCNGEPIPRGLLSPLKNIMSGPEALWWWRTCKSFWAEAGRNFARRCVDSLGCRVAGFTHNIWVWQSGLYVAGPNSPPAWDEDGGKWSWPWRKNTVFCMVGNIQ